MPYYELSIISGLVLQCLLLVQLSALLMGIFYDYFTKYLSRCYWLPKDNKFSLSSMIAEMCWLLRQRFQVLCVCLEGPLYLRQGTLSSPSFLFLLVQKRPAHSPSPFLPSPINFFAELILQKGLFSRDCAAKHKKREKPRRLAFFKA